jgi:hypothetical protein
MEGIQKLRKEWGEAQSVVEAQAAVEAQAVVEEVDKLAKEEVLVLFQLTVNLWKTEILMRAKVIFTIMSPLHWSYKVYKRVDIF